MRVGIVPIADFAVMSYAATAEPFRAANLLAGRVLYEVINIGVAPGMVCSSGAAAITLDAGLDEAGPLDLLFVIAGGDVTGGADPALLRWLARMARQGTVMGGVSGGPVILAQAGLMQARRMTLHWEYAPALSELSPDLAIERTLYVIDRDRMTCAGGTAPMDMMHVLIAQHHGDAFARRVSDWFMHTEIRPPIGPQRAGLVERIGNHTPAILDAVAAMESHIADPLSLPQLALMAGVSGRQLGRLFREQMGQSVMGYYRALRLERARSLLRNSALPLTEIALATGFANSAHFARVYAAQFGQPPSAYR